MKLIEAGRRGERGWLARGCEHKSGGTECQARAVYTVARGRRHDVQDSCRRHLAATVDALAFDELEDPGHQVTVIPVTAPEPMEGHQAAAAIRSRR
jgi:hypothetical protein